ncbi:hypothetical protein GCM10025857_26510 [Alicyclobacillus contaminans]|nr:hypothetical protein GCM10025857_26510 [Alicyclobacillus contaminans]
MRGLTQSDLAEDLVTPSMISQIESDKARPSYPVLVAIANRLGMPVEHFLDELEDQFYLSAHLHLAEYQLLRNRPADAERTLKAVSPPPPPGLDYQRYHLFLARSCRMQGRLLDATTLIEDLREQALRHQDTKLLYHVSKETGQVEYLHGNLEGALHEWRTALQLTEELEASAIWDAMEAAAEKSELYTLLHQLHRRQHDIQRAAEMAKLAAQFAAPLRSLQTIADTWLHEGTLALDVQDYGRAKTYLERASSLLKTAHCIQQSFIADTLAPDTDTGIPLWERAASAAATVLPHEYVRAEFQQIQHLLNGGEPEKALEKLSACRAFMNASADHAPDLMEWAGGYLHQLEALTARALVAAGRSDEGLRTIEQTTAALAEAGLPEAQVQVMAEWLQLSIQAGDVDKALQLTEELQNMMKVMHHRK